jgi:hypothetical protein
MDNYCKECRMMYIHGVKCSAFEKYPTMEHAFELSRVRTRIKFVVSGSSEGRVVHTADTYVASEAVSLARLYKERKLDVQIHESQEVF